MAAVQWETGDRVEAFFDGSPYAGTVRGKGKGKRVKVQFDDGDEMDLLPNELVAVVDEDDEADEARGFTQYAVHWDEDHINFNATVEDGMGNTAEFYGHWRRTTFQNRIQGFAIDMWCRFGGYPYSVESCLYVDDPREKPASMNADICAMINRFLHQRLDDSAMTLDDLRKKADQPILELDSLAELDMLIQKLREFRALGVRTGGTRCETLVCYDAEDERTPKIGLRLNFTTSLALAGGVSGEEPITAPTAQESKGKRTGRRAKTSTKKSGRKPRADKPTGTIDELLAALKSSNDAGEKRRIRAALRAAGHTGGLKR